MTSVTDREFERAVWDAHSWIGAIRDLSKAAGHIVGEIQIEEESTQAIEDRNTLAAMAQGMAALADKAMDNLGWIEAAWKNRPKEESRAD